MLEIISNEVKLLLRSTEAVFVYFRVLPQFDAEIAHYKNHWSKRVEIIIRVSGNRKCH